MKITLSWHEVAMATEIGRMRQLSSLRHQRKGFLPSSVGWDTHCEGACGELAVAKYLGIFWNGSVDTFKECDLPGLQVKTRTRHTYELNINLDANPDEVFVLVTGACPEYVLRGWIIGREAMKPEYVLDVGNYGKKAYFVPQSILNPIETLRKQVAA